MATTTTLEIQELLRTEAIKNQISEDHVIRILNERHGSIENGMRAIEIAREAEAAWARFSSKPVNQDEWAHFSSEPIAQIGNKPGPDDEVSYAKLHENVWIRVWPSSINRYFCFDFVDEKVQYMQTPKDLRIYDVLTGDRVLSIEGHFELYRANSPDFARSFSGVKINPNWETYVTVDGVNFRIEQDNQPDRFLAIPLRVPQGANLILQPYL